MRSAAAPAALIGYLFTVIVTSFCRASFVHCCRDGRGSVQIRAVETEDNILFTGRGVKAATPPSASVRL